MRSTSGRVSRLPYVVYAWLAVAGLALAWLLIPSINPLGFELSGDGLILAGTDPRVHGLSWAKIGQCWTDGYWCFMGDPLYRPLTTMSFALVNAGASLLRAGDAAGQIGVNILLHLLNAVLVYVVLARALRNGAVAVLAALLWSLHPGHLEVVMGVAGRADLLSMAFGLVACVLSLRGQFSAAFVLATCATLSKEAGCFFYAAPLMLAWLRGERDWSRMRSPAVVLSVGFALVVGIQLWRHHATPGYIIPFGDNPLVALSPPARAAAASALLLTQTARWLINGATFFDGSFATPEVCDRLLGRNGGLWPTFDIIALILLGAVAVFAVTSYRARPRVSFCLLWFLGGVLPVSNLIVPIGTAWGDRLLYTPSVGLFALIALALLHPMLQFRFRDTDGTRCVRPRRFALIGVVAMVGMAVTLNGTLFAFRAQTWRTQASLSLATHAYAPTSYRYILGVAKIYRTKALLEQSQEAMDRAMELASQADILWRDSGLPLWRQNSDASTFLGTAYLEQAAVKERARYEALAEAQLNRSIDISLAYVNQRVTDDGPMQREITVLGLAVPTRRLVQLLVNHGKPERALQTMRRCLEAVPADFMMYAMMGDLLRAIGRDAEGDGFTLKAALISGRPGALALKDPEVTARAMSELRAMSKDRGLVRIPLFLDAAEKEIIGASVR